MAQKKFLIAAFFLLAGCASRLTPDKTLAQTILQDSSLATVDTMARSLLQKGFNAGSGYSQVWARDLNTFVETSLKVVDPKDIRGAILVFFALQQANNEMIDGYVLNRDFDWNDPDAYRSKADTAHVGFKKYGRN